MKKILLTGIRFYQRYLSPIKGGSTCKFYPTCSQYAKEAIEKYGALKGGWQCGEFCAVIRLPEEGTTLFLKKITTTYGGKNYGTKFTDCC